MVLGKPDRLTRLPGTGQPETPPFEVAWRERFEEFATGSDDDAGIAGWSPSGLETRMRRFAGLYKVGKRGERWLDAGCGAGTYARMLLGHGADVVGVDYSFPTILKAKARSTSAVKLAVADVRHLPFPSGSFDGVLCFGVMQALSDSEAALRELATLPAAGGQVWVDALNRWCVVNAWDIFRRKLAGRPLHLRYESPWVIKRRMAAEGLANVELHWMPIVARRWPRLQRAIERPAARWLFKYIPMVGLFLCHSFIVGGEKVASSRS